MFIVSTKVGLPIPLLVDNLLPRLQRAFEATHVIERELGGGGMSRTYLATERALDRHVVIKVLAPELLAGVSVDRFKREVLLAAQLQHPHVVPVIASGDAEGLPWFTMPFVDGPSLRQHLANGPLSVSETVAILRDVARALSFAHGRGVVHRDIKPDNVLLSAGSATVTDFGIAKAISASQTSSPVGMTLTRAGMSVGTPAYMAPEQAAGDASTDHRADLYAFGAMAYEMLVGRPPFVSDSPTRLLAMQMSEMPRPIAQLRPDVPAPLAELVMTCLAKEPDARPRTAADLSRTLEGVVTTGLAAAPPTWRQGGAAPFSRMLFLWAAFTAAILSLTWAATLTVGLPAWAMTVAAVLMAIGLVALGFTGWVQRAATRQLTLTPTLTPGGRAVPMGTMATLAVKASPHVSWQRAWKGGGIAVATFVLGLGAFMTARAYGIGPMGSLIAKGALAANEKLILTDFKSPASDTALGTTITEALRADLAQSRSMRVLSRANVRDVLRLMRRPNDTPVDLSLAREVATRDGIKAIVDGEVVQLGSGYVVAARLLTTQTGEELGAFRETASNPDDLLSAVERLSRALRERIGESFKDIRAAAPLERVTTSNVEALKLYVRGMRAIEERNDFATGAPLLEEAIRLDTGFAMAYRKYAVSLNNQRSADVAKVQRLLTKAYELRDRLSESERLLTEASYFSTGPRQDNRQAIAALEALAQRDSGYFPAFNNLGVQFVEIGDYKAAERSYRHALSVEPSVLIGWTNLAGVLGGTGQFDALRQLADSAARVLGADSDVPARMRLQRFVHPEEAPALEREARAILARYPDRLIVRIQANGALASSLLRQGRLREQERTTAASDSAVRAQGQTLDPLRRSLQQAERRAVLMGDTVGGRRAAREALRLFDWRALPDADRDYGSWAIALTHIGLVEEAEEMVALLGKRFERGNARGDGRILALVRGELALRTGRTTEGMRLLREAMTSYPEWGVAAYGLPVGLALASGQQPDSAITMLEQYLASTLPAHTRGYGALFDAVVLERLGALYEDKGNKALALRNYETLLALWKNADPELQPVVRDVRARVERLRRGTG